MHDYTLVHMLCKLLSTEALLKSLEEPVGQAGFHLGGHFQGRFEVAHAEKFTKLEKNAKETNQKSNKLKSFSIYVVIGSLCFFFRPHLPFLWEKNQHHLVLHRKGMVPSWSTPPSLANVLKIDMVLALQNEWEGYKLHLYFTGKRSALRFYGKTWVFAV